MPRTVSMRTQRAGQLGAQPGQVHVDRVGTERVGVIAHTCCAICRRSATAGENRISVSRMPSSIEVSDGTAVAEADLPGCRVALQVADHEAGREQVRAGGAAARAAGRAAPAKSNGTTRKSSAPASRPATRSSDVSLPLIISTGGRHAPAAQLAHHVDARHLGQQPVEHRDRVVIAAAVAQRPVGRPRPGRSRSHCWVSPSATRPPRVSSAVRNQHAHNTECNPAK